MEWIKKLLLLVATVFFAMTVTFAVIRVMPGDPVETMAMTMVTAATTAKTREKTPSVCQPITIPASSSPARPPACSR